MILQKKDWSYERKLKAILLLIPSGLRFEDAKLLEQMKRFAPNEWVKIDHLLQDDRKTIKKIIELGIQKGEYCPIHVPSVIQLLRGASIAIFDPDFYTHSAKPWPEVVVTMVDVVMNGILNEEVK